MAGSDLLFSQKPEWSDVTPLPLDEGPEPVVKIAYSRAFKDAFGYLRAVMLSGEMSQRVFDLTTECVNLNPSCYTVWLLRRKLIENLKLDLKEELDFVEEQIEDNQKNYQVWYHRQILVSWLKDPSGEKAFVERMFCLDSKNYHAWQYRQWLLKTFSLYDDELDVCARMLDDDVRNNSVWNQRYFVIERTTGFTKEVIDRELSYTQEKIVLASRNESPWNYIKGLLAHADEEQHQKVLDFCLKLKEEGESNVFQYNCMLYLYERNDKDKALEILKLLEKEDLPRQRYWQYKIRLLSPEA